MIDTIFERGALRARQASVQAIDRLLGTLSLRLPPGVSVVRSEGGITLSGRGLRHRYVTDARLRGLFK